jgi:hypothetical protein
MGMAAYHALQELARRAAGWREDHNLCPTRRGAMRQTGDQCGHYV